MAWSVFDDLWDFGVWGRPNWPEAVGRRTARVEPAVNVYGDEERLVVTSEIPGIKLDDLGITVHGRTLTISGKRLEPEIGEGDSCPWNERGHGDFTRSLTLPYAVEPDRVEAEYHKGVLLIKLPRVESDKPRRIAIKAA